KICLRRNLCSRRLQYDTARYRIVESPDNRAGRLLRPITPRSHDIRIPELQQLLDDGHIVVASDYPGQGLPGQAYYMVGQANARASLDALRTLEHLPEIEHSGKFVQYG